MYCNYVIKVGSKTTAVVTEVNPTPEKQQKIEIRAGYAFSNSSGKPVDFWKLVNKKFVEKLMEEMNA